MYSIQLDLHTHTIYSGHAFSTIGENVAEAARKGLEAIAMTDHFSPFLTPRRADGSPDMGPMMNLEALPKTINGVRVLSGVEIDIVDFEGHLAFCDTLPDKHGVSVGERLLRTRDIVIASIHMFPGFRDGSFTQNTDLYISVLQNPYVDIIGHPCRPGLPFDHAAVAKAAKEAGKALEINNHSFDVPESTDNCRALAIKCAEEGTHIVVSSDAHSAWFVGEFGKVAKMLEEIHFPQELIANESLRKFAGLRGKCFD